MLWHHTTWHIGLDTRLMSRKQQCVMELDPTDGQPTVCSEVIMQTPGQKHFAGRTLR